MPQQPDTAQQCIRDGDFPLVYIAGDGGLYKLFYQTGRIELMLPVGASEQGHAVGYAGLSGPPQVTGIAAHTIQRAGALRHLVDAKNHVRTFYPLQNDKNGRLILHKRGWKEASTFLGFCDRHDGEAFAPLETEMFTGSAELCFLLGYRALCHELYQKEASARARLMLRDHVDKGQPIDEQQQIQHMFAVELAGVNQGIRDAMDKKQLMDQHFLNRDFKNWHRFIIRFTGDISVASTGTLTPNRDLAGRKLQVLHDPNTVIQHLFYGVVPLQDGGAVVFSWHSSDKAGGRFINSLERVPKKLLPSLLVQLMFAYVENTFFSDAWWCWLSDLQREHIMYLADIGYAYYEDIEYIKDIFVPWKVISVDRKSN